jgi:hypothetical protein
MLTRTAVTLRVTNSIPNIHDLHRNKRRGGRKHLRPLRISQPSQHRHKTQRKYHNHEEPHIGILHKMQDNDRNQNQHDGNYTCEQVARRSDGVVGPV